MYIAIAPGFVYWPLSSTPGQSGGVITRSIDARLAVAALKAAIRARQQCGGDDGPDAGDFHQPSALFTRPVPDMDVFLDRSDLCRDSCIFTAGMRLSSWLAMISSNSVVPLRLFAEMMPSLAICPRIAFDSICGRAPQACSSNNVRSDTPQSRHRQAGRAAKNSFARLMRLRTTTAPPTSTP